MAPLPSCQALRACLEGGGRDTAEFKQVITPGSSSSGSSTLIPRPRSVLGGHVRSRAPSPPPPGTGPVEVWGRMCCAPRWVVMSLCGRKCPGSRASYRPWRVQTHSEGECRTFCPSTEMHRRNLPVASEEVIIFFYLPTV